MPERRYQLEKYKLEYDCDVKGCMGVMRAIEPKPQGIPPEYYKHKCTQCDTAMTFNVRYPVVESP
jgi:hypothetical protein